MRLIDADALIEIIKNEKGDNDEHCRLCLDAMAEIVESQPTIEAVPVVRAEWEVNGVNPHNMTIGNWRCTACDGISLKDSNFCPHCGAIMKGGA